MKLLNPQVEFNCHNKVYLVTEDLLFSSNDFCLHNEQKPTVFLMGVNNPWYNHCVNMVQEVGWTNEFVIYVL